MGRVSIGQHLQPGGPLKDVVHLELQVKLASLSKVQCVQRKVKLSQHSFYFVLAWRILSITLLACGMSAIVR